MDVRHSTWRGGVWLSMASFWWLVVLLSASMGMAADVVDADSDLSRQASWTIPSADGVRERMLAWVDSRPADAGAKVAARARWDGSDAGMADVLDAAMDTFAMLDPRCVPIRELAFRPMESQPISSGWLVSAADADTDAQAAFQRDTVRLWLGRHLVRHDRFDEGLDMLDGLSLERAVDPVALLFHQSACHFWLLHADVAVELLDRLLERADEIPVRYERTARLMRADITSLEDESLDHIARRMRDITRRLDLGHAGPKTRGVQDGVIASLDKLIDKIEQQQQQCQASSGAGGSGNGGNGTPMDDSRIAGGKGAGEVQSRDLGDGEGWGDLPPHQREEALQQIGREFPAHYREAIEQYFKRLASGGESR